MIDEDPKDECADCPHLAMNHYIRAGKYTECGYCDCKMYRKKAKEDGEGNQATKSRAG